MSTDDKYNADCFDACVAGCAKFKYCAFVKVKLQFQPVRFPHNLTDVERLDDLFSTDYVHVINTAAVPTSSCPGGRESGR